MLPLIPIWIKSSDPEIVTSATVQDDFDILGAGIDGRSRQQNQGHGKNQDFFHFASPF
jgi:hypothetical protein